MAGAAEPELEIKKDDLTIRVIKNGGQLSSIVWRGHEILYGGEFGTNHDGTGWQGGAMTLWPAVGRHKDSRYKLGGSTLEMPLHGFVHDADFAVKSVSTSDIKLSIESPGSSVEDGKTIRYPFECGLQVRFALESGNSIVCEYTVKNKDVGDSDDQAGESTMMPFSIGNHLSVAVPASLWKGAQLQSPSGQAYKMLCLAPGSLLSGEVKGIPELGTTSDGKAAASAGKGLPLTDERALDTVLGPASEQSGKESARAPASTRYLELDFGGGKPGVSTAISGGDDDAEAEEEAGAAWPAGIRVSSWVGGARGPHSEKDGSSLLLPSEAVQVLQLDPWHTFVLWGQPPPSTDVPDASGDRAAGGASTANDAGAAPPGRPGFICMEPWLGVPDSLNTGNGRVLLKQGEEFRWSMRIEVLDRSKKDDDAGPDS